jgi:two-component sensor histidine kinase
MGGERVGPGSCEGRTMHRIPTVKRAIATDWSLWQGLAWTVLIIVAVTLARWLIDRGTMGLAFIPYFPFILLSGVLFGWPSGAFAGLLSGILANRILMRQPIVPYDGWESAGMVAVYVISCALLVYIGELLRQLVRELEEAKKREELLSGELLHRSKNTLAIVSALAALTRRRAQAEDFFPAFAGRIEALSRATDLLAGADGQPRSIAHLIEHAIAPFRNEGNFQLGGPACEIPETSCIPLTLVLHELCTNATKHGALAAPNGTVALDWTVDSGAQPVLRLHWVEHGGPAVVADGHTGMGSTLMRAQMGLRNVELRLVPTGAECDIEVEGAHPL